MYQNKPIIYPIEKIVAILSYFTFGMIGLVYLIIALFRKQGLRPFLRYHVFMSIFLSILIYIISVVLIGVFNAAGFILPFLKPFLFSIMILFQKEIISFWIFHFTLVTLFTTALLTYLSVGAAMGKCTYLPWVSGVINYNLRR